MSPGPMLRFTLPRTVMVALQGESEAEGKDPPFGPTIYSGRTMVFLDNNETPDEAREAQIGLQLIKGTGIANESIGSILSFSVYNVGDRYLNGGLNNFQPSGNNNTISTFILNKKDFSLEKTNVLNQCLLTFAPNIAADGVGQAIEASGRLVGNRTAKARLEGTIGRPNIQVTTYYSKRTLAAAAY